jgi:hypothetical protein
MLATIAMGTTGRAARRRQHQDGKATPDEAHAERHHDRWQLANMDDHADRRIDGNCA